MPESRDAAFARLLHEHGPALARLAAAYERDPHAREDLMQEIAFAIWRALPAYRGESSERTFIFRIGHNRAITHRLRSRAWRSRFDSRDLTAEVADPTWNHATADRRGDLMEAVRRLTPALRETVILSLEGLSHQEIADVLGTTPGTVAVRLNRARVALARLLTGIDR